MINYVHISVIGFRGLNESHQMRWYLHKCKHNRKLEFRERATKTRTGEIKDAREFPQREYAKKENPAGAQSTPITYMAIGQFLHDDVLSWVDNILKDTKIMKKIAGLV